MIPSAQISTLCDSGGAVSRDGRTIYVDHRSYRSDRDQYRLRMTIAHEFAHSRIHSTIFGLLKTEADIADLLKFFTENTGAYSGYEIQAFILAGYLLVPEETIRDVTREAVDELTGQASRGGVQLDLTSETVWSIIHKEVAKKYGVSWKAAKKRLEWSGLWGKPLEQ